MNDDLEIRLRDAFRGGSLPAAPGRLLDHLQEVANTPVGGASGPDGAARRARRPWSALAVAAVLLIGGAVAVSIGNRGPSPLPNVAPSLVPLESAPASPARLVYELQWTAEVPRDPDVLAATLLIIRQRIDTTGLVSAEASTDDQGRIVVPVPVGMDPTDLRRVVGPTGEFAFVPLAEAVERGTLLDPATFPALLGSDEVSGANVADDQNAQPTLQILLTGSGGAKFGAYTASHIGSPFAITLDGIVVAAPVINEAIPGGIVQITYPTGEGARTELSRLATLIRFGPLPLALVEVTPGLSPSASAIAGDAPIRCGPRVDVAGLQLECERAVDAAVAFLPAGHPEIKEITFRHGCPEPPGALIDCATQMFGIVVINFSDATPAVRILVDYDLNALYLPGPTLPNPSPSG